MRSALVCLACVAFFPARLVWAACVVDCTKQTEICTTYDFYLQVWKGRRYQSPQGGYWKYAAPNVGQMDRCDLNNTVKFTVFPGCTLSCATTAYSQNRVGTVNGAAGPTRTTTHYGCSDSGQGCQ